MVSKSLAFLVQLFLGNFHRHLVIFSGHTGRVQPCKTFFDVRGARSKLQQNWAVVVAHLKNYDNIIKN